MNILLMKRAFQGHSMDGMKEGKILDLQALPSLQKHLICLWKHSFQKALTNEK